MGIQEVKNRPSWDVIYMALAFEVAMKSLDPDTKHGCFIVSEDNKPLGFGFNSPPQGCVDENIPLTRPDKYFYFEHSEANAILNAANPDLEGSTFYVTGHPCSGCFRKARRVKAKRIIYGPVKSNMISEEEMLAIDMMNTDANGNKIIEMIKFEDCVANGNMLESLALIRKFQDATWQYITDKCITPLKN